MASVIAAMGRAGEETIEAERRFAIEMDRLEFLRLDEGSFQFLKYCSGENRSFRGSGSTGTSQYRGVLTLKKDDTSEYL